MHSEREVIGASGGRVRLLDIEIDNVDKAEALQRIDGLVAARVPSLVVTPNVDVMMSLQQDAEYRRIYGEAALVLTDGVPLLWAARFLGTPIREKLSGSDVFHDVCALAAARGYRLFFMGGREGAAAEAARIMVARNPGLQVAGVLSPPFGFENDEREMAAVKKVLAEARPDILLLGLGSPKQEKWFDRYSRELGIPLTMGVGITFEYTAGMVPRAPRWMQAAGLEWSYRLWKEPRRLWRRYLVKDPGFFLLVLKARLKRGRNPTPRASGSAPSP